MHICSVFALHSTTSIVVVSFSVPFLRSLSLFLSLSFFQEKSSFFFVIHSFEQHKTSTQQKCAAFGMPSIGIFYEHIFLNLMWIEDEREFYYMQNQRACVVRCIFICADRVAGKKEPTTSYSIDTTNENINKSNGSGTKNSLKNIHTHSHTNFYWSHTTNRK